MKTRNITKDTTDIPGTPECAICEAYQKVLIRHFLWLSLAGVAFQATSKFAFLQICERDGVWGRKTFAKVFLPQPPEA